MSNARNGESFGEASLPFEQFASRVHIFQFDPLEEAEPADVPAALNRVIGHIHRSWGADRLPENGLQASTSR